MAISDGQLEEWQQLADRPLPGLWAYDDAAGLADLAREAVPALIAEVKKLRGDNIYLQGENRELRESLNDPDGYIFEMRMNLEDSFKPQKELVARVEEWQTRSDQLRDALTTVYEAHRDKQLPLPDQILETIRKALDDT